MASSSDARSWETIGAASWEWHLLRPGFEDDYEPDYDNLTAEEAGVEFADMLIHLKRTNALSAKQACVLAWWAAKAGACGLAQSLGYRPEAQSGHYSRHFDKVVGCKPSNKHFYNLDVVQYSRYSSGRVVEQMPVVPPHEALVEEFLARPTLAEDVRQAVREGELPTSYTSHPAVLTAPQGVPVFPLAMYLDAVPFSRRDSCLGIFVYNVFSGVRHLVAVFKKSELCQCGCRGWCSLYLVFLFTDWSLQSMARGKHPFRRHDGAAWREGDEARASQEGMDLGVRAIVIWVKGDWAEYSSTLGLPSATHNTSPCPWCFCTKEDRFSVEGYTAETTTCALKQFEHYEAACDACEVLVTIRTATQARRLQAALRFDNRRGGTRGRIVQVDLPDLNLLSDDRVEPSASFVDVGRDIRELPLPIVITFWRSSRETITKHRNPIFSEATGVSPSGSLGVDWLHCLSLGVAQFFFSWRCGTS